MERLHDWVGHWARERGDTPAAIGPDRRLSWLELRDEVNATAAGLVDAGVRRGDRVAVRSHPDVDLLVAYLAVASVGGVFQGLNPKSTAAEVARAVADTEPVLTVDLLAGGVMPVADAAIAVGEQAAVLASDPAAIVHTSGSTGVPKGALLSHGALVRCSLVQARRWYDAPGEGRLLVNLPINHVGCLGDMIASAVVGGVGMVFQPRFDAAGVLALIERERVTYWGAVPAMFTLTVATPRWASADLGSLHRVFWSGGAMPISLARELATRCRLLGNAYGMTETVGSVTYTDDDADLETMCLTVGRPDPDYDVRLADDGEILVRGNHLMNGYFRRPDATAEAIDADGWLHTGDIARRRDDGNLVLVGRTREMFKSGGYNVYPREVELVLEAHPLVTLAAVVALPDRVYGEVGHAVVAGAVSSGELESFARERLAGYKIPKSISVMDALPMLPIGKVDKRALLAMTRDDLMSRARG